MTDEIIPVGQIVMPEHFAGHLKKALGNGFTIEAPRTFSHTGGGSYFKVTCPNETIARNLSNGFAELGVTPAPASMRRAANQTLFHVPNINTARQLVPALATTIEASKAASQQQLEAAARQKDADAALKAAEGLKRQARVDLKELKGEFARYFGDVAPERAFVQPIHVGQHGLGLNLVMLQADRNNDVVFDASEKQSKIVPKGSFYEQIVSGQISENRQWAIYHNPITETVHFFGGAHRNTGRSNLQRVAELATSFNEDVRRLEAVNSGQASNGSGPEKPAGRGALPGSKPPAAACVL